MTVAQERAEAAAGSRSELAAARGPRLSTVFTWVFAVGGFAIGIRPLHDNSFMVHLRTGRLILDHGIPHHDPYSFSAAGTKWVAESWLAELLYGSVNRVAGAFGLRLFGAAMGLAIGLLLFRIALRTANDRVGAGALTLLTLAVLMNVWSERPLMFGILAMLVLGAVVELPDSWVGRHSMVALSALMWMWANSHGTFIIGFGYLAVHLLGRALEGHPPTRGRERVLLRGSALAAAVIVINPYGLDLVLFPLRLLGRGEALQDVAEWQSPNFREAGGLLFGAFLVCTLVVLARKRPGIRDVLITVTFVVLGLWAIRNVGLAVIAILPILGRLLRNDTPRSDEGRSVHRLMVVAAVVTLFMVGLNAAGERDWNLRAYPVAAFEAVQQQHLEGRRIYAHDAWGGYLIATAWPDQKVFFDDRFDMYPIEINRADTELSQVRPGWLAALDRYQIEVVMTQPTKPLAQALAEREDWIRIYADKVAAVYARRSLVPTRTSA